MSKTIAQLLIWESEHDSNVSGSLETVSHKEQSVSWKHRTAGYELTE